MNFMTRWWLSRLCLLLTMIFALWSMSSDGVLPTILLAVFFVVSLVLNLTATCPGCGKLVYSRGIAPPHYCPHCGESLD